MGIYEKLLTEPLPKTPNNDQITSKPANQETSKEGKKRMPKQQEKPVNPIRKFASYLREDSLKQIKLLAIKMYYWASSVTTVQ